MTSHNIVDQTCCSRSFPRKFSRFQTCY